MTNQLLRFVIGLENPTNRDNFINKRIDLSGFFLAASFRNAMREFTRRARVNIQSYYEKSHTEYSGEDFKNVINESNFLSIFDYRVFQKYFIDAIKKGNIELSLGSKKGIVQTLERKSYISDLSHLRLITDIVPSGVKPSIDRRRLHPSQYGCVCPLETKEGGNVGMRKGLSIVSTVTFGCSGTGLIDEIYKMGLIQLNDMHPREMDGITKVFVNGKWIGVHNNPQKLYTNLLLRRRNGLFNIYTSIAWYKERCEIICCTDQGRFCRPLYIVEDNQLVIQPEYINKIKNNKLQWFDLISGLEKRNLIILIVIHTLLNI
jgi:DNA-directed RNA polymerase beta subunit